ncbi:MAG: DUF4416 family protein [Thermotogota bacterium]
MGRIRKAELVNFVIFAFGRYVDYRLTDVKDDLEKNFGEMDFISEPLDFGKYTHYYNKEMGEGKIEGKLISFKELIHPAELAHAKLITNRLEQKHILDNSRTINLDSGYVHHTQFVLASTKPQGHRIYIGKGIYAEVTLYFAEGAYKPLKYTYPNYSNQEYISEIAKIRKIFLKKRKS